MPKIDLKQIRDLSGIKFSGTSASGHTNGMLFKASIVQAGEIYYLKLGQFNIYNGFYGTEPLIELINSRIGTVLGLPVLEYGLNNCSVNIDGKEYITLVQISKDYQVIKHRTNNSKIRITKYSKIDVESMFNENKSLNGWNTPLQMMSQLGLIDTVYKQYVFDYIVCNMDRHGKNTEILINNENPRDIRTAPYFDNSFTVLLQRKDQGYKGKFSYNDRMPVNNFIGSNNLLDNVLSINRPVNIKGPRQQDRQFIFQGLQAVTDRRFRDYTWEMLNSRVDSLINLRNPYIRVV